MAGKSSSHLRLCGNTPLSLESLESRLLLNGDWSGIWQLRGIWSELQDSNAGYNYNSESYSGKVTFTEQAGGYNMALHAGGDAVQFDMTETGDTLSYSTDGYYNEGEDAWQRFDIKVIEVEPNIALVIGGDSAYYSPYMYQGQLAWSTSLVGLAIRGEVANIHRPWEGSYQMNYYEIDGGEIEAVEESRLIIQSVDSGSHYVWTHYNSDGMADDADSAPAPKNDLLFEKNSQRWVEDEQAYVNSRIKAFRGPGDYLVVYEAHAGFGDAQQNGFQWCDAGISLLVPEAGSEYNYGVDLVSSYDTSKVPASVMTGRTFTLPVLVGNEGAAPAAGKVDVQVYAQAGNDKVLLGSATDVSLNLKADGSVTVPVNCVIPAALAEGQYAIITEINTKGAITEIDGDNNTSQQPAYLNVATASGDLTSRILSLKLPANPIGGNAAQAKLAIKNQGNVAINEKLDIDLYLSTDQVLDAGDIRMTTLANQKISLKPGQEKAITAKFNLPASQPDDNYYILSRIDEPLQVSDPVSANNAAASGSFHLAKNVVNLTPSFGLKDVPALFQAGKKTQVKMSVQNNGNVAAVGATSLQLWATNDGVLDGVGDVLLPELANQKFNLKAGGAKSFSFKFICPTGLASEGLIIIGVVDPGNTIVESNETDNQAVKNPG